ncbi:MAG: ATP-grasp domain-containing protein [Gemmatimonadales bacterium]|jgi:predicted ATP-grasp superfamily ATP-dependent carboligase
MSVGTERRGKVLALGREPRSLLAVVRSLGRQGVDVDVGWSPESSPAVRSRYVRRVHDIPPFSQGDTRWKEALLGLFESERYDLVIPCDDSAILPLQRHRGELESAARIYLLSDRAFEVTSSKLATSALARDLGIPVPREEVVEGTVAASAIAAEFGLPVVLKPHVSVGCDDVTSKRFVRKVYDAARLQAELDELLSHGPVQVQQNVLGIGVGVEVMAERGELLVAFQHERVHEPLLGGGSSYRRSAELSPELTAATAALLKALDYTGVAMVEFKVERGTGRWVLVEINGRFWGSLPLAVAAGVDFPYYLYQLLIERRRSFPAGYRVGLYARNWSRDAVWFLQNLRADRSDPTLMTVPLTRVLLELKHLLTLRERSDTFTLDDPLPGLAEIFSLLKKPWAKLARRLPKLRHEESLVRDRNLQEARSGR